MRTTLTLDDDILVAVRERARREKRTAGAVLSDLARQALTDQHHHSREGAEHFFGFEPFPPRGGAISNALIDEIRADEGV